MISPCVPRIGVRFEAVDSLAWRSWCSAITRLLLRQRGAAQ